MALKLTVTSLPPPSRSPNLPKLTVTSPKHHRRSTEIRFSRWNNANAQRFVAPKRTQQEIEDQIRFNRRFDSANRITADVDSAADSPPHFRSVGTPSSPSRPSIPGRVSKYSKPYQPKNPQNRDAAYHPAYRARLRQLPPSTSDSETPAEKTIKISDNGISYVVPGAPFEFQYSYTESPKVRPLKLREAPYTPFGPDTMPRPWTGCAPLSKKKLKEFDSFRPPPPNKKGIKSVQAPGPFLAGSGPKYTMSREEIMGEPLTRLEIKDLVLGCIKTRRQMNMGRDGLTHNMLDNIHAHWKRRRVCKIKCKGVCTVDMNNVHQQLEERTGGKIIYSKGGVIFLFRGRNYNYRTRPRFPLMLWKPITPVYPRLIKRVPEGLTLEEASEMRKRGRKLIPMIELAKNGVYSNLVQTVKEAFEECELARINCQGMNPHDYRKIGAKLRDLVPCVLISFELEHILMWRGREWKPALSKLVGDTDDKVEESEIDVELSIATSLDARDISLNDASVESRDLPLGPDTVPEINGNPEVQFGYSPESPATDDELNDVSRGSQHLSESAGFRPPCMQGVVELLEKAVETGSAVTLDAADLNADVVFERSVLLARSAPHGPAFPKRQMKLAADKKQVTENTEDSAGEESVSTKGLNDYNLGAVPQGSLRIDELAKLLA